MKAHLPRRAGQLVVALAAVSALGGCAVYSTPAPAYYGGDGGPVYVAPAPAYVGPPVFLNFGFWGGGGYRGGWHHRRW
ncbi:MAG TPA: hypothetical protein VHK04_12980 [Castellaniella sp.]|jgi:hypothetical protein|nr:hypothetical protein [Castellaniella sp.]